MKSLTIIKGPSSQLNYKRLATVKNHFCHPVQVDAQTPQLTPKKITQKIDQSTDVIIITEVQESKVPVFSAFFNCEKINIKQQKTKRNMSRPVPPIILVVAN
ncbi:MAG: hypothetical protein WBG71_04325 [Leeuwenhoekiella sp.]